MDGVQVLQNSSETKEMNTSVICKKRKFVYRFIKRLFDIFFSATALVIMSPIFLITALAIAVEDGTPIIYRQKRNGINGTVFCMYKFRSMCKDAEKIHKTLLNQNELDGPAFKMKDDPRVTKVGHFIRKTSIDELPQLVNILKGEMSLVGPRPLPTYETEQCSEYQKQRMMVKPGLTCYWQCSGRNDISFAEWMEMDLRYIRESSFLIDIKIIIKTFGSVIDGKGAY